MTRNYKVYEKQSSFGYRYVNHFEIGIKLNIGENIFIDGKSYLIQYIEHRGPVMTYLYCTLASEFKLLDG